MKKEEIRNIVIRALISVLCFGVIFVLLYFLLKLLGITDLGTEDIREGVARWGAAAPIAFILISFLQVTFIPIPSTVTIVAGALIFGTWESFLYSYIGIFLGSIVAYELGRWLGRPFVSWVVGSQERLDEWISKLHGKERLIIWLIFLLPGFPDDTVAAIAGMMKIKRGEYILMQLICRAITIGYTLFATEVLGWYLV